MATGHQSVDAAYALGADVDASALSDSDAVWVDSSSEEDAGAESITRMAADDSAAEALGHEMAARHAVVDGSGVPKPLDAGMLTLSGEASSKWESLVHLEAIKVR